MNKHILISFAVFIFVLVSCKDTDSIQKVYIDLSYDYLKVPKGFPELQFPANNPYSREKVYLGRKLFYDRILSKDSSIKSCSHCMKQENSFSDNTIVSLGFNDQPQVRNTMVFCNLAYRKMIFWDGRATAIESPAYRSFFLTNVFASDTNVINQRLQNHPEYPKLFALAFGENVKPGCYLASLAIATFVRVLISGNSNYDKYVNGDTEALSLSAKRGMDLFFSDKTRCSVCHSGVIFTDDKFHNTGVKTHYYDRGRYYITGDNTDRGKFLTPSLRNCELTSPYMHDGEIKKLEDVIENYNKGGKLFINKDTLIRPLNLTSQDKSDLLEFLKSLTDESFINNKYFGDPTKQINN